ncbi:MAG TPA: preprotein translocase subunit YajC [Chitinophagales bacterium]|nr:preprotein translocase subunit YajC [Chitinophagales bacterium]
MQLQSMLLMAPSGGESSSGSSFTTIIFFLLFFVILYFFMIRPQSKKAKDQKNFVNEIKPGDRIVTIGGVHGKVLKVDDDTYLIEVDNNVKLRIEKAVISMEYTKNMLTRKGVQA